MVSYPSLESGSIRFFPHFFSENLYEMKIFQLWDGMPLCHKIYADKIKEREKDKIDCSFL